MERPKRPCARTLSSGSGRISMRCSSATRVEVAMSPNAAQYALMYFVLPLWLAAGFADYLCHRASHIEVTSGYKESLIHLLMFSEVAVPLLAAIFFEINALIIATMITAFIAHQLTALW